MWLGHTVKALQVVLVMPLAFSFLSTEEITVWLIFLTLIGLQLLADMGFTPTYTRALSMAFAGADSLNNSAGKNSLESKKIPNKALVNDIVTTMLVTYGRMSLVATAVLIMIGTTVLLNPIGKVVDANEAWIAWGVILGSSAIAFFGNSYIAYLQAIQRIPHIHRLRALTALAATVSIVIALVLETGILGLVIAQQTWQILLILWYRRSARACGMYRGISPGSKRNMEVFDYVWSATWKSGLGILLGYGVIQASGLIYAQIASAEEAAVYLLLLRLMQAVSMFSQAPFYSKLPALSRLWVSGNTDALRNLAARGMKISYWVYAIGVIGVGITFPILFNMFGTNISFPDLTLWLLFGIGGLIERFGAMHIQVYSLTNHIVWHIANGIGGALFLVTSFLLVPHISTFGFAAGFIVANLGFYSWYSARYSYHVLESNFFNFDRQLLALPFLAIVLYLGIVMLLK